jgi:hypothetical protein
MAWTNEIKLAGWHNSNVTVGIDADGDLGFCDEHDYSIILNKSEIPDLLTYLEERIRDSGIAIAHHPPTI